MERALLLAALATALAPGAARAGTATFVPWSYVDPATGLEAFRLLVPKGWKAEGSITWSADPALPARARFRFRDPEGLGEMNLWPTQAFFWTNNPLFLQTNPPGSYRFHTLVARPVDLDAAFDRLILPTARRGATGLAVTARKRLPELARIARGEEVQGVRSSADAGRVRVTYREGGTTVEEEFYAAVAHFAIDLPGSGFPPGAFIDYWYVDHVFSFRAAQGGLGPRGNVFQTMLLSIRVNPRWYARVVHVKEQLAAQAMRGVRATGSAGKMAASASSSLRDDQMKDWERRQQVQERIVQAQSDGIRGVERFHDPHAGKEVELPAGYGTAWANDLGEYIVTDSPGFNPNVGSNLHWEAMPPAR